MLSLRFKSRHRDGREITRPASKHSSPRLLAQTKTTAPSVSCKNAAPCPEADDVITAPGGQETPQVAKGVQHMPRALGRRNPEVPLRQASNLLAEGSFDQQHLSGDGPGGSDLLESTFEGRRRQQKDCRRKHGKLEQGAAFSRKRAQKRDRNERNESEDQLQSLAVSADAKRCKRKLHVATDMRPSASCQEQNGRQQAAAGEEIQKKGKMGHLVKRFAARGVCASSSRTLIDRLRGGRFRSLNEFLYAKHGKEALKRFQKNPELFDIYHAGYCAQVRRWPLNPLDSITRWLKKQPTEWVTGDFGCGEATLALRFPNRKFHSFDLVAANERITACDISNVPLPDTSLHVAVFCLSLMGRDWPAFLREAHRVLKPGGRLIIAEVSSRIASLPQFIAGIEGLGFKNTKQEDLASFFVLLEFSKEKHPSTKSTPELVGELLQPCLYKRR